MRPFFLLLMLAVACQPQSDIPDGLARVDAGGGETRVDAGLPDAGAGDAGDEENDAGEPDAGNVHDAGREPADAGATDSGIPFDGGISDAGTPDAGTPDAGTPDAGSPPNEDAGPPLGPDDSGCAQGTATGQQFRVRIVAANLTSGNGQSYDEGHGIRILDGLNPDVVLVQEFNYESNSTADLQLMTDKAIGDGGSFATGVGQIPNGILSRWPVVQSGEWVDPRVSNRTFVWGKIDLPGPRDLWVVSVHLLTANASERDLEAESLLGRINALVPTTDFLAVGGDFNTNSKSESCYTTLLPRLQTRDAQPVDRLNEPGTNASREKPYDQVLVSQCLKRVQVPVNIGSQFFQAGLVFDSRTYVPLTDVSPVNYGDSSAPNMQHMAVVKDFVVTW